ncbi:Gfo/Idh/MocA family oxidoreductase [Marihabitans asiaticum]|uniref:Myo-inositol 2-dehydrogenase/D-chiro-inositol 1-dehydrogenase n=1 Tax=Marihabitans asiaticum TaxID=415218 RepID=A0A560WFN8_9MICO|nr:Gfo/Idh/MocA family oxidoreductase [Marihabitans asiaticum]TWD16512.1 myo-inositol 2-dehydrogenase/D-chiro-inositol 1-dehydrogenase [Marihabitans asiaticum]
MRIGLIGLGRIGAVHARTLADLELVEELVVTDPVAPAVDAVLASTAKATAVADPSTLLDSGVDGVVIAAATNAHADLVRAAVAKGVPAFCEKPIAASIDEAVAVQRAVAGSSVPVQIGYPRRFDPAFVAAREAVRSGALGHVHTVRSTTLDPAPPPPAYLAVSGGIFRDCAVHDFDAVRWVTGQEVVEVYATGAVDPSAAPDMYAAHGDVTTATTLLSLSDGTIGVVSNTRTNAAGYDVRLEVHGVQDAVAAGLDDGLPLRSTAKGVTWPAGPAHSFFMDRLAEAFRVELGTFCEVAAGRAENPCTVEDAMGTAWTAEAATLSLREGRPVRITPDGLA